ncbi:hypothetical protein RIF29_36473 [Crotalaria pallida]|uniref:Uncharacterized protein n=1 Tax=Crotalaria pallida TaxID=3830 RepID=A0AAN9EDM8_CROPI
MEEEERWRLCCFGDGDGLGEGDVPLSVCLLSLSQWSSVVDVSATATREKKKNSAEKKFAAAVRRGTRREEERRRVRRRRRRRTDRGFSLLSAESELEIEGMNFWRCNDRIQ